MKPPAFVVLNEQRLHLCGTKWPGCRVCGHVYAHAETCTYFVLATKQNH